MLGKILTIPIKTVTHHNNIIVEHWINNPRNAGLIPVLDTHLSAVIDLGHCVMVIHLSLLIMSRSFGTSSHFEKLVITG